MAMNSSILEFQSFDLINEPPPEDVRIDIKKQKQHDFMESASQDETSSKSYNKSFWTFEYYQQFFDVNTQDVKERILWSMLPRLKKNLLDDCIKPNPDLYGPLWICTTLIFTTAVSGNVAKYLQHAHQGPFVWRYNFHMISYAATAIVSYSLLIPILLWALIKWSSSNVNVSFLELLCIYGYSLSVFVPVSILSVIQISWLQWSFIIVAASLSAFVLVSSIGPSIEGPKKIPVVALIVGLHFLLAFCFMLYFFHAHGENIAAITTVASSVESVHQTKSNTSIPANPIKPS